MGRARGCTNAVVADTFDGAFATVFGGTRRGHPLCDLAGEASPGARSELDRLLTAVAGDDFSEPMRALRRHRELLRHTDDNPLLGQLLAAMSQRVCERETVERTAAARAGLRGAGIAEVRYAPNIVAWRRGGQLQLHVWAEGHHYPAAHDPQAHGIQRTVCGRDLSGGRWTRAQRGQWAETLDAGPARAVQLCPKCLKGAPDLSDYTERTDTRFFGSALTREAGWRERRGARAAILAAVAGGNLAELVQRAWREDLITSLAECAHADGGFALQNLLPFETALALAEGTDLTYKSYGHWAQNLDIAAWKAALNDAAPPAGRNARATSQLWDQSGWPKRLAGVVASILAERGRRYPR